MTRSEPTAPLTPLQWALQVLGWLALFASLALLSPGVVLTANGEPAEQVGPSCQARDASRAPEHVVIDLERMISSFHARALADADTRRPAGPAGADEVRVLNNRGYSYPPAAPPAAPDE